MKKLFVLLTVLYLVLAIQAQSPDKMSYQAVVRDTKEGLLVKQNVGVRISILYKEEVIYSELHSTTTNENGLLTIEIGTGKVLTGAFSEIRWAKGVHFLRTEIDPEGKETYTISSLTQLLSVPYSFYASKAGEAQTAASALTAQSAQTSVTAESAKKISTNEGTYSPEMMVDIDGNIYATVKIGTQVWMAENLKATHYRNGDEIPYVTGITEWNALTTGAWCNYNNMALNGNKFGHLYNWFSVGDSRNIAPVGWHVPTNEDWVILENYLIANGGNWDGTTTGNKIAKSLAGITFWSTSTTEGSAGYYPNSNNSSGFNALPAGQLFSTSGFLYLGTGCYWWTSSDSGSMALIRGFYYTNIAESTNVAYNKRNGLSVRCIKD